MHKTNVKKLGYCKECGSAVLTTDKIKSFDIYECSQCGHPSTIDDLLDEIPYLRKSDDESEDNINNI